MVDQGHQVFNRIFTAVEMCDVIAHLSNTHLDRTKAGARHLLRVPEMRQLAHDPRLIRLASGFLGGSATPFRATLFDKSPKANWLVPWHQDTALPLRREVPAEDWGPWSTKAGVLYAHAPAWALEQVIALRVSLDDSSADNGPLRVLPNTHQSGVLTDAHIERLAREVGPVECVAPSGSVIAMRPLTVHASSKAASDRPRRVLHIEYATAVDLGPGVELAVC